MDSEYLRFPFKVKVDYFILYQILVSTFVIFLYFFLWTKKDARTKPRTRFFHSNVYMFKPKQKWKTDYQHVISFKKSSGHLISVSALKLHFDIYLYFSLNDCYFSCYVSLGFTIRTVRTQNNHWGFEFSSFFQTCFPLWLILSSAHKRAIITFCNTTYIWQQAKLMLKQG